MVDQTNTSPVAISLHERGIFLARNQSGFVPVGRNFWILDHLDQQEKLLRSAQKTLQQEENDKGSQSPAAEWILDNFYLVEKDFSEIRQDFPKNYYKKLPGLEDSYLGVLPRVITLAWTLLQETGNQPSLDQIVSFLNGYQTINVLQISEIWAIPIMLRFCLIERLTQAATELVQLEYHPTPSLQVLADPNIYLQISTAIPGLRNLKIIEWKDYFVKVSKVEDILDKDPCRVYPRMDFNTRDVYRKQIEQLANESGLEEIEVAGMAIELAQQRWNLMGSQPNQDKGRKLREGHVGYFLISEGRKSLESKMDFHLSRKTQLNRFFSTHTLAIYLGMISLLTFILLYGLGLYAGNNGASLVQITVIGLLSFIPAVSLVISTVNNLLTQIIPPRSPLPKLDFQKGIPNDCFTLVVIPTLLTDMNELTSLLSQLEQHYLGNEDENVQFALLTDFPDAINPQLPGEEELLAKAADGINALNQKYPADPFILLHRKRLWNPSEGCWMGWERKRGKLEELNRLVRGDKNTSYTKQVGDISHLQSVQYVITLDEDTRLLNGSVHRLVATLAHPLNRAIFDSVTGKVLSGYTILQPRLSILPSTARRTWFAQIFSGDNGIDLYSQVASDVYQDLFAEGNYMGKGIYHVDTFYQSLSGRIPENTLLSHDLFEGLFGRAGLASDIVLYEEFPPKYLAFLKRMVRWIRGDWQLLPWLGPRIFDKSHGSVPNRLTPLGYWKILDNLRRSLSAPAYLVLMITGWLWLPGSPIFWTSLVLLSLAVPAVVSTFSEMRQVARYPKDIPMFLRLLKIISLRWFFNLAFLPYQALWALQAIGVTLIRLIFTKKHLLVWTTAAQTLSKISKNSARWDVFQELGLGWSLILISGLFSWWIKPEIVYLMLPILILWLVAPEIAYQIGQPREPAPEKLTNDEIMRLRVIARRTWLYFEQYIGPEDNWLPPDHFQEDPKGALTYQTSPTNIGLALLSQLAAYDFGYIGITDLQIRVKNTFNTLSHLEKYNGHFLNWYNTRNLDPLPPRYVSTVDSGNLAGCLIALRQGFLNISREKILREERWQGLFDTIEVLRSSIEVKISGNLVKPSLEMLKTLEEKIIRLQEDQWVEGVSEIQEKDWPGIEKELTQVLSDCSSNLETDILTDLRFWTNRIRHQISSIQRTIESFLPWEIEFQNLNENPVGFLEPLVIELKSYLQESSVGVPSLEDLPQICSNLIEQLEDIENNFDKTKPDAQAQINWCRTLQKRVKSAGRTAEQLLEDIQLIANRSESMYLDMDFNFLYDKQRNLFHIGYNVDSGNLDLNYYDLYASEARLASLIAIAKGDIPERHWLYLWRPMAESYSSHVLMSWNGSMFEYLMPALLLRHYPNSLMAQSNASAVTLQIDYGRRKGVPWGISEAGFYLLDSNLNYQYQAFGVPGIGLKRGLEEDLVIAPYASLMAISIQPKNVMENIKHLTELGMLGIYGFYEAIDFTPTRQPIGKHSSIVKSYMVHHLGMSFISITNFLLQDVMINRLHADPRIKICELLLQEQIPAPSKVDKVVVEEGIISHRVTPEEQIESWYAAPVTPVPLPHVISNGHYSVMVTANGSGFSQYNPKNKSEPIMLTRWRADSTLDNWGQWLYLRDLDDGSLWSATHMPMGGTTESQRVDFFPNQVDFQRIDHQISIHTKITVSIDADVEVRLVGITNHSSQSRRLNITSYAEIALNQQNADVRHPAFSKLFVESEALTDMNCLIFHRRPRSSEQTPIFMAHLLVEENSSSQDFQYECDRNNFLGRGGNLIRPQSLQSTGAGFSKKTGATLDPIFAISRNVSLKPRETKQLAFITLATNSRSKAVNLAKRYQLWAEILRTFTKSRMAGLQDLNNLNLNLKRLRLFQLLLSALLYPNAALKAAHEKLQANQKGQSSLWPFSISGDYPILLVKISGSDQIELVTEMLQAHRYWRNRGLKIDLVFLNMHATSYEQELHGQILRLITKTDNEFLVSQRGGIFLLRSDQMQHDDLILLETAARAVLNGENGSLAEQTAHMLDSPVHLPDFISTFRTTPLEDLTPPLPRPDHWLFDNGLGGFSTDGEEYGIFLGPRQHTPAPWINVLANPGFGCLVSESGLGYTWAGNSSENSLTPWRNDPVRDTPPEAIYVRDEDNGQIWSPTPMPVREKTPYLIYHGAGYTTFEHHSQNLVQNLLVFVAPDSPVKVIQLRLKNVLQRVRRVTVTYYAEWVLGPNRENMAQFIIPEFDSTTHALLARNPYNEEFSSQVAFLATTRELNGLTTDRAEFLGLGGSYQNPAGLRRMGFSANVQAGLDPCAALQVLIWLAPGEEKEVTFLLGQGKNKEETHQLIEDFQNIDRIDRSWSMLKQQWDNYLDTITVKTPDPAFDILFNRWLLYQTLACRLWARSAFYQSGGAYGYRDQLQDIMALVYSAPNLAREHLIKSAQHQFETGDVLHWWHPPSGRGIRTRCSDNLLWLPFVTTHYVEITGDLSILDEKIPFLVDPPLKENEKERYGIYPVSSERATLFEHCVRAIDHGITAGPHGLPLIGSHDWNDGLNQVGKDGIGESIWLGWFLYATLTRFAELCKKIGQGDESTKYLLEAQKLRQAMETNAWDKNWYLRAYFDDGSKLGAADNQECKIDSIAQSWAVLSKAADPQRSKRAMQSVEEQLVSWNNKLVLLFTPPFNNSSVDPGYIKGYPPGVRENGGQYTHAAIWALWAFADLGENSKVGRLLSLLNPIYHSDTPEKVNIYRVEPYVVAADVYSEPPYTGRGGWTWYTGSAGWLYRLGIERILGIKRSGDKLSLRPCLPEEWSKAEIKYKYGRSHYDITLQNHAEQLQVFLDDELIDSSEIPLVDDGNHHTIRLDLAKDEMRVSER